PYALITPKRPRPPHFRASLIAHSLASAPELHMNTLPPPPRSRSSVAATCGPTGLPNRLETCWSVAACSATAAATTGCEWPNDVTARPHKKSRYRLPLSSHNSVPRPRTNVTRGAAYVGIRDVTS